jgi:hypothetical protein
MWRFEHPEVAKYTLRRSWRVYRLLKGVKISISTDRNVDSEFIPGYSKKEDILDPFGPRKSDVFFVFGKNK